MCYTHWGEKYKKKFHILPKLNKAVLWIFTKNWLKNEEKLLKTQSPFFGNQKKHYFMKQILINGKYQTAK